MAPLLNNYISVDDLSNGEIEGLFSVADEMADNTKAQYGLGRSLIMASLFFEPSTRTRLSFETAMHRLGGRVITASDVEGTSLAKGESLADMARVVGSYADIIVIRHPWEGAARVMAEYAGVPVINAGDGGHEHPTQTLCDLYTLRCEKGSLKGLKIALWGDLKYGRTTHSLAFALARFGATILFRPGPGLELPEYAVRKLTTEYKGEIKKYEALGQTVQGGSLPIDAIYMTPTSPHQLAMMPDVHLQLELEEGVDALYVTRFQKERLAKGADGEEAGPYPVVDLKLLQEKGFREALVMHPLPRVDELAQELDADERSMYFKQAARGVPVRMALLAYLLGVRELPNAGAVEEMPAGKGYHGYRRDSGLKCPNMRCVTVQDTETKYIKPEFFITSLKPLILNCAYCDHELHPHFIATTEGHERRQETKKYHSADSHWVTEIRPENLIIFSSARDAEERGFMPSHFAGTGRE
ncbi:aspartate carbamoyltransferase catalytic subunit [Chloroflexota bacterium]